MEPVRVTRLAPLLGQAPREGGARLPFPTDSRVPWTPSRALPRALPSLKFSFSSRAFFGVVDFHTGGWMTMDHLALGRWGEDAAVRYLLEEGWTILGRNVRHGRGEVDIIASLGEVVAFVEVKTRTGREHGHPLEAITWAKRREIARVARGWLQGKASFDGRLFRFDAVSVSYSGKDPPEILHVQDAWRVG